MSYFFGGVNNVILSVFKNFILYAQIRAGSLQMHGVFLYFHDYVPYKPFSDVDVSLNNKCQTQIR